MYRPGESCVYELDGGPNNKGNITVGGGPSENDILTSRTLHVVVTDEPDCLENIGRLPAKIYQKATMYTTLSPCHMCTGAILLYGIPRVVLGENETFMGAEDLLRSQGVDVVNLNSQECKNMMAKFISEKPEVWNEDIGV